MNSAAVTSAMPYRIEGSYYEACNCEAVCPCRRQNGVPGGLSTYGVCDFLLSWNVKSGHAGEVDLAGRRVCLAGSYNDDVEGKPWSVIIYIDDQASAEQSDALAHIFQGHFGGNILFTNEIGEVLAVRRARIELDHKSGAERIRMATIGGAEVVRSADFDGTVSCGIPGHDHPGRESVSALHLNDGPFDWSYDERCGFATDFSYRS
jgi:hypothetical protein